MLIKKLVSCRPISINVDAVAQETILYPDPQARTNLLNGLRSGFHTGLAYLPTKSFECNNLLSTKQFPQDTTDLLSVEVEKGYVLGPYASPPFDIVRINPLGIVQAKYSTKKRLIVDMSSPHDNQETCSLNDLVNKEEFSLSYVKLDDAIRIIKSLRADSPLFLCKTDISDAFKQIPIHASLWPYHGVRWKDQYYFFTRLVFGSRSSPKIFDSFAQTICWILEHNYGVTPLLHLLDDFLVICPPGSDAQSLMDTMLTVFAFLGVPLSAKKTVGPVFCLEYLGVELCTRTMEARLPPAKLHRIRGLVHSFLNKTKCTKRQLLSLLGHLQFACRVIAVGRAFTARLLKAASSVKHLSFFVSLNQECRKDLAMWDTLLTRWNGISLFLDIHTTDSFDMELFTDASGKGYGGYFSGAWFMGRWPEDLEQELHSTMSIAFMELYPIVVAAVLFGEQWDKKRIMFRSDNMATVYAINKGRSQSPAIMQLMRRLVLVAATCNFAFAAQHIPGTHNDIADAISRFQIPRFRRLAPHADQHPTPLPTQVLFA